jgi:hypothetical protein
MLVATEDVRESARHYTRELLLGCSVPRLVAQHNAANYRAGKPCRPGPRIGLQALEDTRAET